MQSFTVIGLGQFGRQLAVSLAQHGAEVLAVDSDMAKVEEIKDVVSRAARADASNEDALRALGVGESAAAIVALGEADFEDAVLAVAALKQLGVPRIVARSSTRQRGRILSHVGAHQVIFPEVQMAEQLARALSSPGVVEELSLPSGHTIAEIRVPERFHGMTLADAHVRAKYGLNVLAIRRERPTDDGKVAVAAVEASPGERIDRGDVLVVVGERDRVEAFARAR